MVLGTPEILLIIVWIYLVFWISRDAKRRGKNENLYVVFEKYR